MKQFFKMFFASLLALVLGSVLVVFLIVGIIASFASSTKEENETKVDANSVLVIETDKQIHESSEKNSFAIFSESSGYVPGLYEITQTLKQAKEDKNIKGIFIKVGMEPNGWATMNQIRTALMDFKKSGKFIYAYGEVMPQKSFYITSVADSIFLNPAGFAEFSGLSTQIPFFKGTLEKLEVEPVIFYAGKFKSATEPFRADKMSEPNRQQVTVLQNNIWQEMIAAVAQHSHQTPEQVHQIAMNGGIQFPETAVQNKLVDGLRYLDEVENLMRKKTDKKETEKLNYVSLEDYASNLKTTTNKEKDRIAVLMAEGEISDGEKNNDIEIASKDMVDEIVKLRNNENIKAVVLRVNSPGGSALASEVILRELQLLKKKKPLIVSMGDVAASGGYYISSCADSIFALQNTITGSIGVFTMMFNAEKMLHNKLGVTFDGVKNAPYADFPNLTRSMNAEERNKMQMTVDTIYSMFKNRVATGRKLNPILVDSIAQGRVWSGKDALNNGLIDAFGDLDRAIASAANKAKISKYKVVTYPQTTDKLEVFMRKLEKNSVAKDVVKSAIAEEVNMGQDKWLKDLMSLMKKNGRVQMVMPFSIEMK